MPALPPVPNVVRVRFGWTIGADLSADTNSFWRYTGSPPDTAECDDIAGAIFTIMGDQAGLWASDTVLANVRVTDLSADDSGDATSAGSAPGERTGGELPAATSLLLNFQIGRRYRGGKPRVYLPWGTDTDLASRQRWTAGFITAAQSSWVTVSGGIIGTSAGSTTLAAHTNVSFYQGFTVEGGTGGKRAKNVSTPRTSPLVNDIVGFAPSVVIASQRRRNRP